MAVMDGRRFRPERASRSSTAALRSLKKEILRMLRFLR